MRKIPTLFVRDPEDRRYVTASVTPGCEWVLAGEGIATRKYDGTCVMRDDDGHWWARREVKLGKPAPRGFVEVEHDDTTGKRVGWEPIDQSPFAKFHAEALAEIAEGFGSTAPDHVAPRTYELVGPKINGNPDRRGRHVLIPHGEDVVLYSGDDPRTAIEVCRQQGYEGIVWHHPDGRMAKLKARDLRPERSPS